MSLSANLRQNDRKRTNFAVLDFEQQERYSYFVGYKTKTHEDFGLLVRKGFADSDEHVLRFPSIWRISGISIDKDKNLHLVGNQKLEGGKGYEIWVSHPIPVP